ncbi:sensor histidine kinase [Niallia endozanthoxylica]|uniref:Histidine kinase domain-containing protein n=1 Tax=Niallia endozanthoxylica TaxID=2036016 RepID=A0A5J5HM54_9BACI|nr:ATP-binding protein [Niallia endozanthoxylica]KAA9020504.1 hypothetical protein F4V44_18605 [Niallia endozanthoxylica]
MKKFIINNTILGLPILLAVTLTIYFTVIILRFPLIGMEVREESGQWIVANIYENGWASSQPIVEGDILKLVNDQKPENHSTVKWFKRVEMADSITISNKNVNTKMYTTSHSYINSQYLFYLLLPFFFTVMTILLSIFIYRKKKNDSSAIVLIYFLLSIGVCYLSASVSSRGDIIGTISNIITLSFSLILFVHFLKSYFLRYNLVFIGMKSLRILYTINLLFLFLIFISLFFDKLYNFGRNIQLLLFLILIVYLFFHLIQFYIKSRNSEGRGVLKILGLTLFVAFSPFLCFYGIPKTLFGKELALAETTAAFLIVIPISFVYLQLVEKLFDIEFLLSRMRYYALLSFPFTLFTILILKLILNIKLLSSFTIITFIVLFIFTILFLYTKEYLDYKISHHLFSQKSHFESSLYKFFQKAKNETKVNSLIQNLMNEISDVLMVEGIEYIEVEADSEGANWFLKNRNNYSPVLVDHLEKVNWVKYGMGSLIEFVDGFIIVIGGDYRNKNIIFCGMKKFKTNLNIQEKIWLETLAYISGILLENFQLIEDLFQKIETYKNQKKETSNSYPSWLSRLLFTLSEKERLNLSIDLHDSVLQDSLQILREVDNIVVKVTDQSIKNDLYELKERILDNIHLVRETCNELRPPFLTERGFFDSIQYLFEQTKLRSNFILHTKLESTLQIVEKEYELILYRVVQELLNNAMKHSKATNVKLSLTEYNQVLTIVYQDDGIGMDMTQLKDSFKTIGLSGIKERVRSIGGTIKICSGPGKGMNVLIEIATGSDEND